MSLDVPIRFSRKVTVVSFILSIFIMYIHANQLVQSAPAGTPVIGHAVAKFISRRLPKVYRLLCGGRNEAPAPSWD